MNTVAHPDLVSITIKTRMYSGTYMARSGRFTASCTSTAAFAAQRVAQKYFTALLGRNVGDFEVPVHGVWCQGSRDDFSASMICPRSKRAILKLRSVKKGRS